jgi:hypothetical protein
VASQLQLMKYVLECPSTAPLLFLQRRDVYQVLCQRFDVRRRTWRGSHCKVAPPGQH